MTRPTPALTRNPSSLAVIKGEEDPREWSTADLLRGYRPTRGPKPSVVPRAVVDELRRRITADVELKLVAIARDAAEALGGIVSGAEEPSSSRLAACQYVLDRVLGKAPDKVEITETGDPRVAKLQAMIATWYAEPPEDAGA